MAPSFSSFSKPRLPSAPAAISCALAEPMARRFTMGSMPPSRATVTWLPWLRSVRLHSAPAASSRAPSASMSASPVVAASAVAALDAASAAAAAAGS